MLTDGAGRAPMSQHPATRKCIVADVVPNLSVFTFRSKLYSDLGFGRLLVVLSEADRRRAVSHPPEAGTFPPMLFGC